MCRNITVRHKWNDHGGKAEQKDIPNKRSFFPVINEERGHLVHKLRNHDDNVVEEKHERGTCLQRLWPLCQAPQLPAPSVHAQRHGSNEKAQREPGPVGIVQVAQVQHRQETRGAW